MDQKTEECTKEMLCESYMGRRRSLSSEKGGNKAGRQSVNHMVQVELMENLAPEEFEWWVSLVLVFRRRLQSSSARPSWMSRRRSRVGLGLGGPNVCPTSWLFRSFS